MIYIVNGRPGSGKTTFERAVCKYVGNGYCYSFSTIDFVKYIARICGWDETKTDKNRKFLSDLKDLLADWGNVPFKDVEDKIEKVKGEFEYYGIDFNQTAIFIDSREPWEIKNLCNQFNAKSVLIRRPGDENIETSNHADADVFNYNYDIVLYNNGDLNDLEETAIKFIKNEKLHTYLN